MVIINQEVFVINASNNVPLVQDLIFVRLANQITIWMEHNVIYSV